jgi:hypothetical protein
MSSLSPNRVWGAARPESCGSPAVIPAKAGIHVTRPNMDPRFRGDDGERESRG